MSTLDIDAISAACEALTVSSTPTCAVCLSLSDEVDKKLYDQLRVQFRNQPIEDGVHTTNDQMTRDWTADEQVDYDIRTSLASGGWGLSKRSEFVKKNADGNTGKPGKVCKLISGKYRAYCQPHFDQIDPSVGGNKQKRAGDWEIFFDSELGVKTRTDIETRFKSCQKSPSSGPMRSEADIAREIWNENQEQALKSWLLAPSVSVWGHESQSTALAEQRYIQLVLNEMEQVTARTAAEGTVMGLRLVEPLSPSSVSGALVE